MCYIYIPIQRYVCMCAYVHIFTCIHIYPLFQMESSTLSSVYCASNAQEFPKILGKDNSHSYTLLHIKLAQT